MSLTAKEPLSCSHWFSSVMAACASFLADAGYSGPALAEQLRAVVPRRGLRLDIVRRCDVKPSGFVVQPKRWIVKRSFAWLSQARRLTRDYETKEQHSAALILIAASRFMLRRLAVTF